jgi:hypothetical protein
LILQLMTPRYLYKYLGALSNGIMQLQTEICKPESRPPHTIGLRANLPASVGRNGIDPPTRTKPVDASDRVAGLPGERRY